MSLKKIGGNTLVYGVSSLFTRSITIFLMPVYSRLIPPEELGLNSLIASAFFLTTIFCIFGMDYASGRWYFIKHEHSFRASVFSNWFFFQICLTSLFIAIALIGGSKLSVAVLGVHNPIYLAIPSFTLLLNILPNIVQNYFRFEQKAFKAVIFATSFGIVNILFTCYLVIYHEMGVRGIILSSLFTSFLFSIWGYWEMQEKLKFRFVDKSILKSMLRFAFPLVPSTIAIWLMSSSATYFLDRMTGKSGAGLFSLGNTFASAITLLTASFASVWGPYVMDLISKKDDPKKEIIRYFDFYVVASSLFWLGLTLFSKEIVLLLTDKAYHEAYTIIPLLSLATIFNSYSYFTKIGNDLNLNSIPLSVSIIIGSVITVIMFFLLIPIFGINGAALSCTVGQLIIPVYVYFSANRKYPIRYNFLFIFLYSVGIYLTGFLGLYFLSGFGLTNSILVKSSLFLISALISISLVLRVHHMKLRLPHKKYTLI